MSSLQRLSDAAWTLTADVNRTGAAPPAVARANPLIEVLLADVAQQAPEALRQKLSSVADPGAFLDWLGMALLFRSTPPGADARVLLAQAGNDPQQATMAWVRMVAPLIPPAPPTAEQKASDVLGIVLEVGVAALLYGLRCGLAYLSAGIDGPLWWLSALTYLPLKGGWLFAALGLCLVDLLLAPCWMDRARLAGFRLGGQKPIIQMRADMFLLAWRPQALALASTCIWRLFRS